MNDFEKSTLLNFYTNYYLSTENYPEAIRIFEKTLTIESLRQDIRLRTHRSLGQLYAAEENWQESINNYQLWRDLSEAEDDIVYRGLAFAHYQLEDFETAKLYWIAKMELVLGQGESLERDDYAFLNGLYFTLEDFQSALELTKTMIVLFDNKTDWQNLSAIYSALDNSDRGVQALNIYYLKGMLDDDSRFVNLAQSLAGVDAPYSGSKILAEGLDSDIVPADEENLTRLTQMHMMANEYKAAVEPATAAAEADETGNGYDTLGYIRYVLHDYAQAAEAFQAAIEKGSLNNRSDTLIFLARTYLELKEFDAATEAATDAADIGDERASKSARDFIQAIERRRTYYKTIAQRKEDAIDFYQPYPAIQ
jgi:tetratricopeptide (TPR) repeat protein